MLATSQIAPRSGGIARPRDEKVTPMKFNIEIDCTPEEARRFLGLPDVAPMQDAMMKEIEARMMSSLKAADPETLFKTWLPAGIQGWEQMQRAFWSQMSGAGGKGKGKEGGNE